MASTRAHTIIYQSQSLYIIANNHIHYSDRILHFCFQNLTLYLYAWAKDLAKCIYAAEFDFAAILLANHCFYVSDQRSIFIS